MIALYIYYKLWQCIHIITIYNIHITILKLSYNKHFINLIDNSIRIKANYMFKHTKYQPLRNCNNSTM
jgi:hypothetical protein